MTIVFVTNFYNHHQAPFAYAMDTLTEHKFFFIETMPMSKERKAMGWGQEQKPPFVLQAYANADAQKQCQRMINDADAVIWGSCPMAMIRPRLRRSKLTFAYSERLFKTGKTGLGFWGRIVKYYFKLRPFQKNHYLLCASAYAAEDYAKAGLFKGRAYRWGYFPEVKDYEDIDQLIEGKEERALLWAGRMISWKHPELAVEVARKLRQENFDFCLKMIGCGEKEESLRHMIEEYQLENCVCMLGAMKPEEVRRHMEKAQIFLFTSDQNEGWGAVLNEAMNSACAVIANEQIGSAPYLVQDGKNGLLYSNNDVEQLTEAAKTVLTNRNMSKALGKLAYETLQSTWNAKTAATRLVKFIEDQKTIFPEGPMRREK